VTHWLHASCPESCARGERLLETKLGALFSMSGAPVREALRELEAMG
jgi:DNA-binding GntR family transcriptional regulator